MKQRIDAAVVAVFESNPFATASVVTIQNHLQARGLDVSEPEVRDSCERLVDEGTLEYERAVYDRVTYAWRS